MNSFKQIFLGMVLVSASNAMALTAEQTKLMFTQYMNGPSQTTSAAASLFAQELVGDSAHFQANVGVISSLGKAIEKTDANKVKLYELESKINGAVVSHNAKVEKRKKQIKLGATVVGAGIGAVSGVKSYQRAASQRSGDIMVGLNEMFGLAVAGAKTVGGAIGGYAAGSAINAITSEDTFDQSSIVDSAK